MKLGLLHGMENRVYNDDGCVVISKVFAAQTMLFFETDTFGGLPGVTLLLEGAAVLSWNILREAYNVSQ